MPISYLPTYYPNAHDAKEAIAIAFTVAASVRSYDLAEPEKLRVITVRGRITDAAGLPPKDQPQIRIKEPGLYGQIEAGELKVDSEGRFEVQLCEWARYSAFAFAGPVRGEIHSAPMEFTARDSGAEMIFVLNKTAKELADLIRKVERQ